MSKIDDAYCSYVAWSLKIGVPPLNPLQYEKVVSSIHLPHENNLDAILRNNNPKKDRPK